MTEMISSIKISIIFMCRLLAIWCSSVYM